MLLRVLHTTNRRRRFLSLGAIVVLGVLLPLLSGCRLVGRGTLEYVPAGAFSYPEFATPGTPLTVLVFRHEEGNVWPPEGKLGLLVSGNVLADDYYLSPLQVYRAPTPVAASCADLRDNRSIVWVDENSPLTLRVRSEGTGPWGGPPPVGVIQEWLTVDDAPAFWDNPTWVLTDHPVWGAYPPYRCGVISVVE